MNRVVMSAVFVSAISAVAAAQTDSKMAKTMGSEKTPMMSATVTYTGCLEAGTEQGTFTLTHAEQLGGDSMKKNSMAHGPMEHDMMMSESLKVTSTLVGLIHHVGQKVSVTGSSTTPGPNAMGHENMSKEGMSKDAMNMNAPSFTIKKLKTLATSCS
jgi:hypothetical protein